jgi:hypothetical protein
LSQGAVIGLTSTIGAALIATAGPPEVLSRAPIWGVLIFEQGGVLAGQVWFGILAMLIAGALVGPRQRGPRRVARHAALSW